jgi:hypothetical protein
VQLTHTELIQSPDNEGWTRLVGEVTFDDLSLPPEQYWLEVPDRLSGVLSRSGNPWLAYLLPLAVRLGEPLRIDIPVDRVLFENTGELMRIWKGWYPHLHVVPVEAEAVDAAPREGAGRTASLFSGGVDGFHTVLDYDLKVDGGSQAPIDDLIVIWGFDVPLHRHEAIRNVRESLQGVASEMGKEMVEIAANVQDTLLGGTSFMSLSHGAFLVGTALALEERYDRVLISSTYSSADLHSFGSHPLVDPLLSTERMQIVHYGTEVTRTEKTALVVQSDVAMRVLRVCRVSETGGNCGGCDKCYYTMIALDMLGALDRCETFKGKRYDLEKVAHSHSLAAYETFFFSELAAFARLQGKPDVAQALERGVRRTKRARRWLPLLHRIRQRLENNPALWRPLRPVRRALRALIEKVFGPVFGDSR